MALQTPAEQPGTKGIASCSRPQPGVGRLGQGARGYRVAPELGPAGPCSAPAPRMPWHGERRRFVLSRHTASPASRQLQPAPRSLNSGNGELEDGWGAGR